MIIKSDLIELNQYRVWHSSAQSLCCAFYMQGQSQRCAFHMQGQSLCCAFYMQELSLRCAFKTQGLYLCLVPLSWSTLMNSTFCLFEVVYLFDEWAYHVINEFNVNEALKSSIFVLQKAGAQKIGEEFCQGSNGTIKSSLATSPDVSRRRLQ